MKTNKHFFAITIGLGVVLLATSGYVYFAIISPSRLSSNTVLATNVPSAPVFISQFDGTSVSSSAQIVPVVMGFMIDNHPDARPQFGLSQARVVYEAPVEGGLTRYFAFFNKDQNVAKVGPIRSARPYFLDWLAEYGDSSYWHCGGSPEALDLIKQYGVWDVNQYFRDPYFWRATDRDAPHNLFTSSDKWRSLIDDSSHSATTTWQGWLFSDTASLTTSTEPISQVMINYQSSYVVSWRYDKKTGRYVRLVNDRVYRDDSEVPVQADSVVVQTANVTVLDEVGRRHIDTIGHGDVRIFRNGVMIRGTWKKADRDSRTRFYDINNQEIPLQGGQIWVQVIPQDVEVNVAS